MSERSLELGIRYIMIVKERHMKIKIDIDPTYEEGPTISIQVREWNDEVEAVVRHLKEFGSEEGVQREPLQPKRIIAVDGERSIVLHPTEIDYVCAEKRKVFAVSGSQSLELKMKLYELEELLAPNGFIRFSKSVIGNVDQIDRFELSFNGNLCVYFKSGSKEYVTRKYVHSLKNQLVAGGGQFNE